MRAVVDCQVQCHHAVAARGIRQRPNRSGRALRVGHAVDPGERLARGLLIDTHCGVTNRQM